MLYLVLLESCVGLGTTCCYSYLYSVFLQSSQSIAQIDLLLLLALATSFGEHLSLSENATLVCFTIAALKRVASDTMRGWSYDQKEIHQVAHGCAIPAQ